MTNVLKKELARQEDGQVRSNIERIISSYRHVWDIYTELLQNSADAIFEKFGESHLEDGEITLSIFPEQRRIIIEDNGVGISETDISKILVTGKSLKRENKTGKFGFMGFGFTFVAFQSKYLKIESTRDKITTSRTYYGLYKYVFSNEEIPNSIEERDDISSIETENDSKTKIIIQFPESFPQETVDESLAATFRLSKNEDAIKAVLRTKTIVGYLEPLFNGGSSFKFNLFIDTKEIEIKTGYLTTKEIVKEVLNNSVSFYDRPTNYESLIQVTENLPISSKDLARKAILLDEKIDDVEIGKRNPILARFYISATSKSHINTFNEKLKDDDDTQADHEIEHGLWLAICGMPIGVCLDSFDHSNYLPYTILVDIKDVAIRKELDAGRKGISSYRMNQIIEKSKELLTKHNFIKYRRYVVGGGDTRISDPLYDPKTELNNLLHDKEIYVTPLKNRYLPPIEEQEVIALFTELISINAIKGYLLKILSGYQVYDGLYIYNLDKNDNCIFTSNNTLGIRNEVFASQGDKLYKDILVEFKLELGGIYKDIDKNRKDFSQIDLLICWDTNFYDKEKLLKNRGDILQEVDTLSNVYYGVTHYLIGAGRQQVLPIIELKKVMQVLYGITIK